MRKISIDDIAIGTELRMDVFTDGNSYMPLLRKGNILTKDLVEKLKSNSVHELYVDEAKLPKIMLKGKQQNVWSIINAQNEKRGTLLTPEERDGAIALLRGIFNGLCGNNPDVQKLAESLDELANRVAFAVCNDKDSTINVSDLRSDSDFLYHHSLSTAVISIAIGHSMNFDYNSLVGLSKCALLHDIGKNGIPTEILYKDSTLTPGEFETVKSHTTIGYSILLNKNFCAEWERQVVLYHHERVDGNGYPYRVSGEQIPLFSRIISIADVFDAMTSKRTHREPISPAEAFEYIMSNTNIIFDYNVVSTFMKRIEVYPVGSFVELSTGNIAVVADAKNTLRPVVRLVETNSVVDLFSNRKFLNVVINRIIPPKEVYTVLGNQN